MTQMHWIIDRVIETESATEALLAALRDQGQSYSLVRKPPTADYLCGPDSDNPIDFKIDGPSFAVGSTSMELVSLAQGWAPGYIDAPGIDQGIAHWGEHMLNSQLTVGRLDEIPAPLVPSFTRPVNDGKAFAGTVHDYETFEEFRALALSVKTWTTLPPETIIAFAPVKRITAEYRCLVVSGRFITGCRYKLGSRVRYVPGTPDEVQAFVGARIKEWNPRAAIIMDIAETEEGLKIIETNSVSSAGFYAMDMALYAKAIGGICR